MKSLSSRWFFFGSSLHLSPDTLQSIEANNGSNCERCLYQALTHWLKKDYNYKRFGHPSYRKLCVSVSNGGQNKALAEEIANERLVPTSPSTGYEQTPSPLSVTSDGEQSKFFIKLMLLNKIIIIVTPLSLPSGHTIFSSKGNLLNSYMYNICIML